MKTKILSLLFVAIAMIVSTSAFTQPLESNATETDVVASTGTTVTYSIAYDASYAYYWEFQTVSGTAPAVAPTIPAAGASGVGANQLSVTWDVATANGQYKVKVYIVDGNGCYSEMIVRNVTVTGNIEFDDATASTTICSDLDGTSAPATEEDGTFAGHSTSSFDINYTGTGSQTLTSVVIALTNPSSANINLDGTSATGNITVTNPDIDNDITINVTDVWENTTSSAVTFDITLVSGTLSDGSVVAYDPAKYTRTITVYPKTTISWQ